jgi:parvulin-like peptidyl-prolyl isomerase
MPVPLRAAVALVAGVAAGAAPITVTPAAHAGRLVDRVVAIVDEAVILESELDRRVQQLSAGLDGIADPRERERRRARLPAESLDAMIDEELLLQAAVEAGLEVSAKEIDAGVDMVRADSGLAPAELERTLRAQGYPMAALRADIRRQILRSRAINVMVRPRVTITDDDVRAEYDARRGRTGAVAAVRLFHLLIAVPADAPAAQLQAAREEAASLLARARAGEEFPALARAASDDAATAAAGGDLGWIAPGSIATEWEQIVFGMSEGETRGPVPGPRGLHLFHVAGVERAAIEPFARMKQQLRDDLFARAIEQQTRIWLAERRERAHVETRLGR